MLIFDFYAGTGSATQAFEDAGHTVIRSIHEDNPPYCCSMAMRQIYGSFAINFKGKGWGKDA